MIALRIDGIEVAARPGETVLRAGRRAGIEIPSLCDHDLLRPYGACRLCVVEVRSPAAPGRPARARVVASCEYPARPGIEVATTGDGLAALRRAIVGMMLTRAPEAPAILGLAERLGAVPLEIRDQADGCVMCGLCTRVCAEVVGAHAIGFAGRGARRTVGEPPGHPGAACIGCGACDRICPTGKPRMQEAAAERFRRLPGEDRTCRYSRMGIVPGALCAASFECDRCEVEHAVRARFGAEHPALASRRDRLERGEDGGGAGRCGGG